jgi:hypothetical protein
MSKMKAAKLMNFSVRGFSPLRTAYMLVTIGALLWPYHLIADWRGNELLAGVALLFVVAALALGFLARRSHQNRFRPAVFAFALFVIHWLTLKL